MQLNVSIRERIATYNPPEPDYLYVCGNGGDTVQFDFDDEWQGKDPKTARFISDAGYTDVEFTGDTCEIPVFEDSSAFTVGVYIGEPAEEGEDILASTGAIVPCKISIRYSGVKPSPSTGQNYTNEAKGYAEEAKKYAEALANTQGALTLKAESYVGESYCSGQIIDVTGLMEEGHVYLLVFRYIGDVFSFILPTYASGGEGKYRGCFGGYNEMYNTNTPVHPYFVSGRIEGPDASGEWVSNQFCEVTLLDETNQNVTLTITGSGDYYMQVYKLV